LDGGSEPVEVACPCGLSYSVKTTQENYPTGKTDSMPLGLLNLVCMQVAVEEDKSGGAIIIA
jgi:hypothetical protein